jgi:signal transduction histidine kinase
MHDRHLILIDAAVAAFVAVIIVVAEALHGGSSTRPAVLALGIGAAVALGCRRRWPGWTLAVTGGLVGVLFFVDRSAAALAVLAPAVALYSLALRRGRWQQIVAGTVAVAAVVVADVYAGKPSVGQTFAHVMLVAIPLLAAEVIRTHQANLKLLVERVAIAEETRAQEAERRAEQERMRIARDLHDVVAHTLTEINITAAAAAEVAKESLSRTALERIEQTSHSAIGELRGVLGVLRDTGTVDVPRTPPAGIDDITTLVANAQSGGVRVHVETQGSPRELSEAAELAAYRIVQEALTNARRHAPAADVTIRLRYDAKALIVTIENGPGHGAARATPGVGVGIVGMRERAMAIGGQFAADELADGFRVRAELPYGRLG